MVVQTPEAVAEDRRTGDPRRKPGLRVSLVVWVYANQNDTCIAAVPVFGGVRGGARFYALQLSLQGTTDVAVCARGCVRLFVHCLR